MKVELSGKILTKFIVLRGKTCIYLIDDGSENEKTKKCAIKRKLKR